MDDEGNEKSQPKSLDYLNMSSIYGSVTYVTTYLLLHNLLK